MLCVWGCGKDGFEGNGDCQAFDGIGSDSLLDSGGDAGAL